MVDANECQVVARIGFAERWLHRAKRHYWDGDATRGFLSVVLAKAEMHYALETGGLPTRPALRLWVPAVLMVGAFAVFVALATDWFLPPPAVSGAAVAAPIVQLTAPVGTWLNLVQTATIGNPAPPPAVLRQSVRGPQRFVQATATIRQASPAVGRPVAPVDASVTPTATSLEATTVVAAPPALHLSAADLIDLAITADRTLRRVPTP